MHKRRRSDQRVALGTRVGHVELGAAAGDGGVDREDTVGEGWKHRLLKPAAQHRSLSKAPSLDPEDALLELKDSDHGQEQHGRGNAARPGHHVAIGRRFDQHPRTAWLAVPSIAIYANFFADHWGIDVRWLLVVAAAWLFRRTVIHFTVWRTDRRMPLLLGLFLVAVFIWFGENLGTAGHAWLYPSQIGAWTMVSPTKLTSWFLLMLVSYTLVAVTVLGPRSLRDARVGIAGPAST